MVDLESSSEQSNLPKGEDPPKELHQHHVSKLLDDVLEGPSATEPNKRIKHPMLVDFVLAIGLLMAVGAFVAGLIRMYIAHSAEESITKGNFKAAIAVLEGPPFPSFFAPPGSEPAELLDQALYLDAMEKLNAYSEDQTALRELERIEPGSQFFDHAQTILREHFKPSAITLQGGTLQEEHISAEEANARRSELTQPPVGGN